MCFGWLGFGVEAARVGGFGWCIRAALGLVFLALFWPGLGGLDL